MILLIDNYDSFTYNIYHCLGLYKRDIKISRNDEITIKDIKDLSPSHIIISSGLGQAEDAGISMECVRSFSGLIPILGVGLGHRVIARVFNEKLIEAKNILHGKSACVHIANACPIFKGLSPVITAGLYHSLLVDKKSLGEDLRIIAELEEGDIMGLCHVAHLTFGIEFHPQSILTPKGEKVFENFLRLGQYAKVY